MRLKIAGVALIAACFLPAQTTRADSAGEQANPAAAAPKAAPFVTCPAGAPLGAIALNVLPAAGNQPLPFRTVNHLSEGDTLRYAPILRGKEKRPGEVALVLVPAKRLPGEEDILVTEPKSADKPQQWKMDRTISLAALVYGPAGLNRKGVAKFLSRDEVLVAQLADYADKTAQAEQLVTTLSNAESSAASVNAALNGFASEYGFAVQVNRSAPVQAQAATVFAAMNPQLAAYNPLATSTAQRVGESASLATTAGTLFFGSPVGLAAGGTAMLLDLRSIAFPDTQFRASFAQALDPASTAVNLCGQQGSLPPHTRAAYIWAARISNAEAPAVQITPTEADFLPAAQKSSLPVTLPAADWKYMSRAREWTLTDGQTKIPVSVAVLGNQKALELDLAKAKVSPGNYKLNGFWDWTPFQAAGLVHVLPLSDFKTAHLDPLSQDRLMARSGKVPVTVKGSDFEFTTKVELQKVNDEFATPQTVRFILPKGLRKGPQDHMDVQVDTADLDAGAYKLLVSQQDGKSHGVEFAVLPNPPKIDNLPILTNEGVKTQHFVLKGERLQLLKILEAPGAVLDLGAASANDTERDLTVEFKSSPKPGTALSVTAYVRDRTEPLRFPDALQITGPQPVIASSRLSLPKGMAIAVHSGEFPAGLTLDAMLDVKNIERKSALRLACADGVGQPAVLPIGGQTANWNLQQLSADQLFLAFDTTALPAGCSLEASLDNGRDGLSRPVTLAHLLRVPQIDSFSAAATATGKGTRSYQITGRNLEMIAGLGWDANTRTEISGLPTPIPGQGLNQSIEWNLADPPTPGAPLFVWLWGDKEGRLSTLKAPALPAPQAAATVTKISSSLDHSLVGQAVTFVANVIPASAAGTVSFMAGDSTLGTAALNAGEARFTTPDLSGGLVSISAVYSGSAGYARSTSQTLTQTVTKGTVGVVLTSAPNPSAVGQAVTFTAVVKPTSGDGGTASGTVSFESGDTELGSATLDANGTATFSTPALATGNYSVTGVYRGSRLFMQGVSKASALVVR